MMYDLITGTLLGLLLAALISGLIAFTFLTWERMVDNRRRIAKRINATRRAQSSFWQPCVGCCGDDCDWDLQRCGFPKRRDAPITKRTDTYGE